MKLKIVTKGGSGSGHFGHAGRPGEHGGSLPGTGGGVVEVTGKYSWNSINSVLTGMNYSPRRIANVLAAMPRGKSEYSWEELNNALMDAGHSPADILRVLRNMPKRSSSSFVSSSVKSLVGRARTQGNPTKLLLAFFEDENLYGNRADVVADRKAITEAFNEELGKYDMSVDMARVAAYNRSQESDVDEED